MPEIDMGNGNQFDAPNGGVTQSEHDKNLAMAIEMRENEVYQYQTNINNYTAMLAACIQDPWPQRLLPYRGMGRDQLAQSIADEAPHYQTNLFVLLKDLRDFEKP